MWVKNLMLDDTVAVVANAVVAPTTKQAADSKAILADLGAFMGITFL
jgi:hypothetical protein